MPPASTPPLGHGLPQGKKLPANISEDAEEGEVSDEDSADEIDEDCKLLDGDVSGAGGCGGPGGWGGGRDCGRRPGS